MTEQTPEPICSACGGTKHVRPGSPWHDTPICKPCFMVWYETGETDPVLVGLESLKLKHLKKFPWTGEYADV